MGLGTPATELAASWPRSARRPSTSSMACSATGARPRWPRRSTRASWSTTERTCTCIRCSACSRSTPDLRATPGAAHAARDARSNRRRTGAAPGARDDRAGRRDRRDFPRPRHLSAQARGAPATAAELAEHAFRLTPETDIGGARRRLFLAAAGHHVAGDSDRAIVLLARARAEAAPGVERARILVQLAAVQADPHEAEALYDQALAESEEDDALEATTHLRLAALMQWGDGVERGLAHSEQAATVASRTDDVALRCCALAVHGDWRSAPAAASPPRWTRPSRSSGPLGRSAQGRADLGLLSSARVVGRARRGTDARPRAPGAFAARDDAWAEAFALGAGAPRMAGGPLGRGTAIRGQLVADSHAARSRDAARRVSPRHHRRPPGSDGRGTEPVAGRRRTGEGRGDRIAQSGHEWVLGFVELSLGDATAALPHLRRSYDLRNAFMHAGDARRARRPSRGAYRQR